LGGTLELAGEVFELSLIGRLQAPKPAAGRSLLAKQILHGFSGGRDCSLLEAFWVSETRNLLRERKDGQTDGTQRWNGYIFIDGLHVLESTTFPEVLFEIPNSDFVWAFSNMDKGHGGVDLEEIYGDVRERTLYASSSGTRIVGSNFRTSTHGQKSVSASETWTFQVSSPGLSLDAILQDYIWPLEVLIGVLTHKGTSAQNLRYDDRETVQTAQISIASNRKVDHKGFVYPALRDEGQTADGPLDKVCQNWITVARDLVLPMSLIDPGRPTTAFLSNRVVELVNAAELLHRRFRQDAADYSDRDLEILTRLDANRPNLGLNSNQLSRIKGALRLPPAHSNYA
jgi:hypothetical protein